MNRYQRSGASPRPFKTAVALTVALPALAASALSAVTAQPAYEVTARNADTGRRLGSLSDTGSLDVPADANVELHVEPIGNARLDRALVHAGSSGRDCLLSRGKRAIHDTQAPFVFTVNGRDCRWTVGGYDDGTHTRRTVEARIIRTEDEPQGGPDGEPEGAPKAGPRRFDFTRGTNDQTALVMGRPGTRSQHGVRVFCVVSHFSYDDPIVHPGKPDAAHLHMFLGNTSTEADTTAATLKRADRSSCEGGTNLKSSYWMPALFDANDQVVLPERFVAYYKTFIPGPQTNRLPRGTVKPIPDGLEMLASEDTLNYGAGRPPIEINALRGDSRGRLKFTIAFPQCVATDPRGRPVLSHRKMPGAKAKQINSHLAYQASATGNANACPSSHPYRIPGVTYNVYYDIDPNSRWYIASDTNRSKPGHSLHADYFAAWDRDDMAKIVQCNEEGRSCGFGGERGYAPQLPERFYNTERERLYINGVLLDFDQTRTPFGKTLGKMRHGSESDGH